VSSLTPARALAQSCSLRAKCQLSGRFELLGEPDFINLEMIKDLLVHRLPFASARDRSIRTHLNANLSSEAA